MIPVSEPEIREEDIKAVVNALRSKSISGSSSAVAGLEKQMNSMIPGSRFLAVSSGTSAIDCAIDVLARDVPKRAVVPATSIISTVTELIRRGFELEVLDVEPDTFMPSIADWMEAVSDDAGILVPTHIYGLFMDLEPLVRASRGYPLRILEDAAECFGMRLPDGTWAGTQGDIGVVSFYANKFITGGEGGGLFTSNEDLFSQLVEVRNLGFSAKGPRFVHQTLGRNARMPGLIAALVGSQLTRLHSAISAKRAVGLRYRANLEGHPWIRFQRDEMDGVANAYWVVAIVLNDSCPLDANSLSEFLRRRGIESRRFFYPLHLQPCVIEAGLLRRTRALPVSEDLWNRGLYVPSSVGMDPADIDHVCEALWDAISLRPD